MPTDSYLGQPRCTCAIAGGSDSFCQVHRQPEAKSSNLVSALETLRNGEGNSWVTLREAEAAAVMLRIHSLEVELRKYEPSLPSVLPDETSRELAPSEAATFDKAFARSPRRVDETSCGYCHGETPIGMTCPGCGSAPKAGTDHGS